MHRKVKLEKGLSEYVISLLISVSVFAILAGHLQGRQCICGRWTKYSYEKLKCLSIIITHVFQIED